MTKRQVFISYSRLDYLDGNKKPIPDCPIAKILDRLKKGGIEPWIDVDGEYVGHSFVKEIMSAIKKCDILLFISSKESNLSEHTPSELDTAKHNHKLIIPVRIDDTDFSEVISYYIPTHIDRVEYFKNPELGLDQIEKNIIKEFKRLDEIERVKQEEEYRIEKEKEIAEKARIEAEKQEQKKATIKKELNQIKTKIKGRIEKDEIDVPRLITLEKELDSAYETDVLCPVCGVAKENNKDFCETCGWFFRTPAERIIEEKTKDYDERLNYSTQIWEQKENLKENLEKEKSKSSSLIQEQNSIQKEYQSKIKALEEKISNLKENLEKEKSKNSSLVQERNKIQDEYRNKIKALEDKISNLKDRISLSAQTEGITKPDFAYVLAEEYGQFSIYRLREGINTFGSISKSDNSGEFYQMIVSACPELQPKHFSIRIEKNDKTKSMILEPYSRNCAISLNNKNQQIGSSAKIEFNDILYIGELKLTVLDMFNK